MALVVSPPKAGKTTILKELAAGISANYSEVHLMAVLIGERPEEVTDISRNVKGEVYASNFDESPEHQTRVAEVALDRAKRLIEMGHDVVILLDSITRLARAYNLVVNPSGRTLTGGFDPAALYPAKKFLGAARCNEPSCDNHNDVHDEGPAVRQAHAVLVRFRFHGCQAQPIVGFGILRHGRRGIPEFQDLEFKVRVTSYGAQHPITRLSLSEDENRKRWDAAPALLGFNPPAGAKPGATVLAQGSAPDTRGQSPIILAFQHFGRGKSVAFTTPSSWRWKMGLEHTNNFHEVFWKQMLRWLVGDVPD